jgi:hypothetical protein
MSYYDDQEDAWFANDCKGSPDEYDPYTDGTGHQPTVKDTPKLTKSQKRNAQRKAAKIRNSAKITLDTTVK